RQQIEGLRAAIDNLDANLRIRVDEIEQLRTNIEESERKETESREEIARRETELTDLRRREQEQQGVVLGLTNRREELRAEMGALEKTARELKHRVGEVDADLGDLRLEVQELKLRMDGLVERVQEEYQLDLPAMYQTYQPEEMNWEEVAARIEDLRQKIANMGNVNLDAIDSEDELQQRAEFLNGQRSDLAEAKHKLEDIIQRLNKQSLEMFMQSFAVVRANFQEMFRKLFGGGKADLFLEDEQDVLESGIEIIARPPGKEPRSISLLSGGEKVMTAVALLFAIFKARPSPFCILDEVDAALDEANIGRFANILQGFLEHSQFIIITHSKRTMAIADVIYGITMQDTGVSKKISVKFEEYEQPLDTAQGQEPVESRVA
ncbi:MAG TPA: AAA family ATPase, partial [Planctomycetota bacterium]|nr:AAA family ATPase [Planctomycetota bacterium]